MVAVEVERRQRSLVAGAVVLSAASIWLARVGDASMRHATLLSGWMCAGLLAAGALAWWSKDLDDSVVARRIRRHAILSILLVTIFVVHIDARVPGGWIDRVLAALFAALIASTVLGAARVRHHAQSTERVTRWLSVHVALVHATLALAALHGVLAQFHGALAHFSQGK